MPRLTHSFTIEPPSSFAQAERLYREHRFDEALNLCRAILSRAPAHFDALHLSGVICLDRGDHAQASEWLAKAEQLHPSAPRLQYHLGNSAMAAGRTHDAIAHFHKALALEPELPDALNNLGTCFRTLGRDQEAIACFEQVRTRDPAFLPALYNLAITLARIGRTEEAIAHFATVIGAPQYAAGIDRLLEARDALAGALMSLGKYAEALAIAKTRTELNRDDPRGEWHESLLLLTLGNFRQGLPLYERRWELPGFRSGEDAANPPPRVPDLSKLAARRVHLYAEQGRGDTVQFVRYAPLVRRYARSVSVSVPADLTALIRTIRGIDSLVADSEPAPASDLSIPLMSLPLLFKTEMATIPSTVPYLSASQILITEWQERLGTFTGLRVGLCWWGAQHIPERSIPIHMLAPLLRADGIQFHALQKEIPDIPPPLAGGGKGEGSKPSAIGFIAAEIGNITDHRACLTDFAQTAALISCLDLVITIDTSVAHIAGALGRPVWLMLQRNADWRWFIDRNDSPWYPTARLFRQQRQGDWEGVVAQVAQSLLCLR